MAIFYQFAIQWLKLSQTGLLPFQTILSAILTFYPLSFVLLLAAAATAAAVVNVCVFFWKQNKKHEILVLFTRNLKSIDMQKAIILRKTLIISCVTFLCYRWNFRNFVFFVLLAVSGNLFKMNWLTFWPCQKHRNAFNNNRPTTWLTSTELFQELRNISDSSKCLNHQHINGISNEIFRLSLFTNLFQFISYEHQSVCVQIFRNFWFFFFQRKTNSGYVG